MTRYNLGHFQMLLLKTLSYVNQIYRNRQKIDVDIINKTQYTIKDSV